MIPSWLANNALWEHGTNIVLVLLFLAGFAWWLWRPGIWLIALFFIFTLYFFRVPHRVCKEALHDPAVLVCPADGRVVDVQYSADGAFDGCVWKIAIFLSPLDVHVNWLPTSGHITRIVYRPGNFTPAFVPKSSERNERLDVHIQCADQRALIVRQIAGMVARRIVCWIQEGDMKKSGQLYGMIRFGSRVEVLLPASVSIEVGIGQRVYGGSTVIGRWL